MFPADLTGSEAIVVSAMDVLGSHCLVIHLHNVSVVARGITLFVLIGVL